MSRSLLNALGPLTHLLAGLIALTWATALGLVRPGPGLVIAVVIASLLPDIDSGASMIGRLAGPLADWLERTVGHRTLTHSAWFAGLVGLACWLWFPAPDWWIIWAAWLSHLVIDMIVGARGLPLFWPAPWHFYLVKARPGSPGELLVAGLCGLALLFPLYLPQSARTTATLFAEAPTATPSPTATATPLAVVVRIPHVYDPATEILVEVGDIVEKGQLLANLATWRDRSGGAGERGSGGETSGGAEEQGSRDEETSPLPLSTPAPQLDAPSPPTFQPSDPPTPHPYALPRAAANLRLAQAEATRAARPPSATEVAQVCERTELLLRQLWRDQIARDMAKAAEMAWEVIHVQEIDLDILEGDIATAAAECEAIKQKPHAADAYELAVAAARLEIAQVEYQAALAALTPTPTRTATPTLTPTPTRTPTPTPWPAPTPEAEIFALVGGIVSDVQVVSVVGNEATVEITILPGRVELTSGGAGEPGGRGEDSPPLLSPSAPLLATLERVADGDTIVVQLATGGQETVRLIGIDTPESVHPTQPDECYGPEAAAFTRSLLPPGTAVQLELDAEPRDRYGRLLAYVWLNGEMLNRRLLAEGYAEPLRIAPNVRYAAEFERLAGEAQAAGRGLWGRCR